MTVTHVMIGKCYLCPDSKQLRSNPGLKLANAFGVNSNASLAELTPDDKLSSIEVVEL